MIRRFIPEVKRTRGLNLETVVVTKEVLYSEVELVRINYPMVQNFLDALVQIKDYGEIFVEEFGEESYLTFFTAIENLETVLATELSVILDLLRIKSEY